jgi:hypothetical protein
MSAACWLNYPTTRLVQWSYFNKTLTCLTKSRESLAI